MKDYQLTCCSTADMTEKYFKERNIEVAFFHYTVDGKQYLDDFGKSLSYDEFYTKIASGSMPTTSQTNVWEYIDFFEPILKKGLDILHIEFSSGLSGSYNSCLLAREDLLFKYPEREIKLVDSLAASSGHGLMVDTAWEMKNAGMGIDELYSWLENNKLRLQHWFFTTDLSHLKRGGRVSAAAAMMGTMLNICPLMNVSYKGELMPRKKIRGKKQVMNEMVRLMEEHAQDGLQYSGRVIISNSACYNDARVLADMIEERFINLNGKVLINTIGSTIGSHTGPGTVALFYWGDYRVD